METKNVFAGVSVFLFCCAVGISTVLYGQWFVYLQITDPIFRGIGWPVSVLLTCIAVFLGSIIVLIAGVGLLSEVGVPQLGHLEKGTLVGGGGFVGSAAAIGYSLLAWNGTVPAESIVYGAVGESVIAILLAGVPISYVLFELMDPEFELFSVQYTNDPYADMDPEEAREKRVKIGEDPEHLSAFAMSQHGPDTNESRNTDHRPGTDTGEPQSPIDFTDMEFLWKKKTDVSFNDVGGMESVKEELKQEIVAPLQNPEKAEALGVTASNTVFYGPPGTGKTFLAKALATELELPFAQLSGSDVTSKWINESPEKISSLFREAEHIADQYDGAVIFLDELDSVLKNRSAAGKAHEEDNKVVNEFLTHLENTGNHGVVFIGATNRLDSLDEASIRAGRIDNKIHIGLPNQIAREKILRARLRDRPHQITDDQINSIAIATEGLVAADLEQVVGKAASRVLRRDGDHIQYSDIIVQLDSNRKMRDHKSSVVSQ